MREGPFAHTRRNDVVTSVRSPPAKVCISIKDHDGISQESDMDFGRESGEDK